MDEFFLFPSFRARLRALVCLVIFESVRVIHAEVLHPLLEFLRRRMIHCFLVQPFQDSVSLRFPNYVQRGWERVICRFLFLSGVEVGKVALALLL